MFFLLTRRITGLFFVSLLTALFFAVHPIHTEAVSYLSGRRDILSALFFLSGFFFYVKGRQEQQRWLYALVLLCYAAGVLSKEMAITLPLMILAYEVIIWIGEHDDNGESTLFLLVQALTNLLKKFRWIILGTLLFVSFYLYVVVFVQGASGLVRSERLLWWGGSPAANFATVCLVVITYIYKLFFPIVLQVDYHQFPYVRSFLDPRFLFSFTLIISLMGLSFMFLKRERLWTFSIWWFFVTLLPVMHIIPHHILMAEHYLYLPSYGFCLALGLSLHAVFQKQNLRGPVIVVAVVLVSLFSVRTMDRNQDWQDSVILMRKGLQSNPGNPLYHFFLGRTYALNNLFTSANRELDMSISPRRDFADMHAVKALVSFQQGKYEKGVIETQEALEREPTNQMALYNMGYYAEEMKDDRTALEHYLKVEPDYESGHSLLKTAYLYMKSGDLKNAEEALLKLLKHEPDHCAAHLGLADVYTRAFRFDEALQKYNDILESLDRISYMQQDKKRMIDRAFVKESLHHVKSLQVKFDLAMDALNKEAFSQAHHLLGEIYMDLGDYNMAEKEFMGAVRFGQAAHHSVHLLGKLYLQTGNFKKAEPLYVRLLESESNPHAEILVGSGEFYAKTLRFKKASELFHRALEGKPEDPDIRNKLSWSLKLQGLLENSEELHESGFSMDAALILSDIYVAIGRKEDAADLLEDQLKVDPDHRELLERLASLYATMGYPYWQRTIKTYRHLLALDEKNAPSYRRLGEFYYSKIEDYESALRCFQRSLALDPGQEGHQEIEGTVEKLNQYVTLYLGN